MSGKLDGRSYAGTLKNFQSTHIGYRAHRAVIFAIAWHLVKYPLLSQERVKIRTSNLAGIHSRVNPNKVKNFGEKAAWAYPGTAQSF